jgi:hypothetical protein
MKELLLLNGFRLKSRCSCSGTYAEKYIKQYPKGLVLIEIKPSRNVWNMRIDNVFTSRGTTDNLEIKLKEYELI